MKMTVKKTKQELLMQENRDYLRFEGAHALREVLNEAVPLMEEKFIESGGTLQLRTKTNQLKTLLFEAAKRRLLSSPDRADDGV